MKRRLLLSLLLALLPSLALAAVTWTNSTVFIGGVATNYHSAAILSDGSGNASGAVYMHGFLVTALVTPGADAAAPDTGWDCTLAGPYGGDVMGAALTNLGTATGAPYKPLDRGGSSIFERVDGSYTLSCTGMGAANTATILFAVQE